MPIDPHSRCRLFAELVASIKEDIRCHRENGVSLNPYSTSGSRESWQNGFDNKPDIVERNTPFLRGRLAAQLMQFQGSTMLLVELDHASNPDLEHGYWGGQPKEGFQIAVVESFAQASQKATEYIERNDLGSGNWTGGTVFDEHGTVVARVSYNGRVWAPDGSEIAINEEDTPDTPTPNA
jgi:hypothetical protein